jgi:hypothetical protein
MRRPARLQSARHWLPTYEGKNIVKGYRKHFGVDWDSAFKELELLGVPIDPEYKTEMLKSIAGNIAARKRRKLKRRGLSEKPPFEQDWYFAYIAGYTEGGFAYGITWEEWNKLEQLEMIDSGEIPTQIEDQDEEEDFAFDYDSLPLRSEDDDDVDLPF